MKDGKATISYDKTESRMDVDPITMFQCRNNQTSLNSRECRRRLFARLVRTVTEDSVEQPLAINSAGGHSTQDSEPEVPLLAQTSNAKATSKRNLFTHMPKDPNCESCKMTNTLRAKFQKRLEMRRDDVANPIQFGEVVTADHKVLSEDNESMMQRRYADTGARFSDWNQSCPIMSKSVDETKTSLQQFLLPSTRP